MYKISLNIKYYNELNQKQTESEIWYTHQLRRCFCFPYKDIRGLRISWINCIHRVKHQWIHWYLYHFQFQIIKLSWIRQWNEAWRMFKMGYEWNLARIQNWWVVKTFFIALIVGNFMVLPASPNYYFIAHISILQCSLCKCEKPFWIFIEQT